MPESVTDIFIREITSWILRIRINTGDFAGLSTDRLLEATVEEDSTQPLANSREKKQKSQSASSAAGMIIIFTLTQKDS